MADKNGWISVDQGLPDKDGDYLVLANDIINQWQEVVSLKTHHYTRFLSSTEAHEDYVPIVTHWKHLNLPEAT